MLSLRELQGAVRRSMVAQDDLEAAMHVVGDGIAPMQRLAVYRNTYDGNLANALRLSYPAVHRLVGADFFEGAARIFAHQQSPDSAWLDEYGVEFPHFLKDFPPAATLAYLPDVARLEWAVSRALHARDVQPLDAKLLAALEPVDHERVCFVAHPSLSLLRADCPADTIWRAVLAQDDAGLSPIDLADGPFWLQIERTGDGVAVTRLDERQWRFVNALTAGLPLGAVLEVASGPQVASLLADHIATGRFVAFSLAEPFAHEITLESAS